MDVLHNGIPAPAVAGLGEIAQLLGIFAKNSITKLPILQSS